MDDLATVLVVDDEEAIRDSCRQALRRSQYQVETASDGTEALRLLQRSRIDLVLLDLKMPGLNGLEFLRRVKMANADLDVIVMTGYSSVESAVECMRLGAYDYLPKPFDADTLRIVVRRALEKRTLSLENRVLRLRLRQENPLGELLGESVSMRRVREMIERVADSESTVLILGESGTGKELVARAIHRLSRRRDRPFIPVDCGALVESLFESELFGHVRGSFTGAVATRAGRFELAHGGTIFLDEIGNIAPTVQSKLLRAIQEKEVTKVGATDPTRVDVRILAATNQDVQAALASGRFREDLFYRLSVVVVAIPPLRDRHGDIPALAAGLLRRLCERKLLPPKTVTAPALSKLQEHSWPGNVRELENTLERAMILARGPEIVPEDLEFTEVAADSAPAPGKPQDLSLEAFEAQHIRKVLDRNGWRIAQSAQVLGIDRKTLWRKIKTYRLR
jgi:DNA-binding NtrC family response regulator